MAEQCNEQIVHYSYTGGLQLFISCILNKRCKSIITLLHLVLWPTVNVEIAPGTAGPASLSLPCQGVMRNWWDLNVLWIYSQNPPPPPISPRHTRLSSACKTKPRNWGVEGGAVDVLNVGGRPGQDNDNFAAHSITIGHQQGTDHPGSIFNGVMEPPLAIFVQIWIWNCSWLCHDGQKYPGMINPLKFLLLHNTAAGSCRGLYFCGPEPQLHHKRCQLSPQRWTERRESTPRLSLTIHWTYKSFILIFSRPLRLETLILRVRESQSDRAA